jgi:hypothetical protein
MRSAGKGERHIRSERELMATLGQVGELVTSQLRERVDRLVSAIEDDSLDFAEVTRLADTVGSSPRRSARSIAISNKN